MLVVSHLSPMALRKIWMSKMMETVEMTSSQKKKEKRYCGLARVLSTISEANTIW